MNIRNKLFIVIIAVAAINLFFFVSISFLNTRDFLRDSISHDLDHIAEARKQEIEVFFEGVKGDLLIAQGYYNFKKNLPVVDSLFGNELNKDYVEARRELDGQMRVLQGVRKLRNIILLDKEGEPVYFSNPDTSPEYKNIVSVYFSEAFANGKNEIYLSDPHKGALVGSIHDYFMLASAPIYDDNKIFIGEVVFDVGLNDLFYSVQNAAALGETGEVIVGKKINNEEILILNPLPNDPGAALNKKIAIGSSFGQGLQRAIASNGGFGVVYDYDGVEVLASWFKIPAMDWGLVVKMDTREAFAPISNLVKILALLISIEALVVMFFIFFVAKSITDPVIKLKKGMEIIAGGNLNHKVAISTKDEIGSLSRGFDKMIQQLKDAQFMYTELIETTPLCIKVFNGEGKLIFINKGGRDEHFIKSGDDLGKWNWLDTVTEPYKKMAKEKFNKALKGELGTLEFQHTPGGSKHEWCSGILSPVKDEAGKVKNVLFYSTDVTALRRIAIDLEQKVVERTFQIGSEKEKFSTLVEHLPVGVVMVRASDGNLIELNKKAKEFFDVKGESILEKGPFFKVLNFVKVDGTPYPKEELPMFFAIKNGESLIREDMCIKKAGGTIVNFRSMAVPVRDVSGKVVYGIGVMEDITKEKNVEKMRMDFLSLASHQLRTPLSGTKWLVETLKMEKFGSLNPKQKQYLDELEHVNERMIRLVFDMLNALKFESGSVALKKEQRSVSGVFDEVLGLVGTAAQKKGIVVQNLPKESANTIIETDITLLRTVLEVMLSNAVEYSKSGQTVVLGAREDEEYVTFSIKDFGAGIPEEEKARIAEKFYRASNAKLVRPDGTGLGLYTAFMLAEKIEGKITFESKINEGSIFYLRIPKKIDN